MTTQPTYKHNPKTKIEKGDATLNWSGKNLTSSSVGFNTNTAGGLLFANYLRQTDSKNSKGGNDSDIVVACFLSNTDIPERFDQPYKAGSTNHPFRWGLFYEGAEHFATEGSITGVFSNGYRKIEAEIRMLLENGETVVTLFNAEKV
ncbi:hypothetical protein OH720_04040 [Pseudomonas sp. WJP1]|uniref:hypothetical protein n=1 Tax=Pseudomonas sp. WJP1 TaxID=2986947 RepID=UPI002349575B|nr:hypothetical protein [Pseudomonas sp. WJP1]WCM52199.1 hypothetical protein OH720_04040 [Pseudomonas sp. WJP1]